MRHLSTCALCLGVAAVLLWTTVGGSATAAPAPDQISQFPSESNKKPDDEEGPRLPNGKLQSDAIVKHDHEKNLETLREIRKLTDELIAELEANTEHVFSLNTLKKFEQLEKLSKQAKSRFRK
jgi:hypothetical protein